MDQLTSPEYDEEQILAGYSLENMISDIQAQISGKRIVVVGGYPSWRHSVKAAFSKVNVSVFEASADIADRICRTDIVICCTFNMAHSISAPLSAKCRSLKIPFQFMKNTNLRVLAAAILNVLGGDYLIYRNEGLLMERYSGDSK